MPMGGREEKLRLFGRQAQKKRRERFRAAMDQLKSVPCVDCGGKFPPVVMDFDHVRGKKSFNLSAGYRQTLHELLEEIDKCEIVCANCHRLRTQERSR